MERDSDMLDTPNPSPEVEAPAPAAALAAIAGIFTAPRRVFEQIRAGLPWWPAVLCFAIATYIFAYFFIPWMNEAFQAMLRSGEITLPSETLQGMSPDDFVAQWRWAIAGAMLLFSLATLLLSALFYWLAVIVAFGSTSFGRLFTTRVYVGFIELLFSFATLLYLVMTRPEFSNMQELTAAGLDLSPALLLPDAEGFLARLLRSLNVFALWRFAIFNAGVAYLLDRRWLQTFWPVAIIFLLGVLFQSLSG